MAGAGLGVGFSDVFVRRTKVNRSGLQALVAHLFLDDRQSQFVNMNIMHNM